MSPAQKAHQTRYYRAARNLAERIAALPAMEREQEMLAVIDLFKTEPARSRDVIQDAFWILDNEPGRFYRWQEWHPKLRRVRNNPEFGRQLFALWA
jgi:hypothetical protein